MSQSLSISPAVPDIQSLLQTYQGWVRTVAGYIGQAVSLLDNLYARQDQIIDELKALLARNRSLRHADFERVFARVLSRRDRARRPLARLAENYAAAGEAVRAELAELFKSNVARARQAWPELKARLLDGQRGDTQQAVAALRRMHVEQEELSAALAGLLTRGEKLRIDDLRTVAHRLANSDSRRSAELADLLANCETAARQANENWQKLAG